MATVARPMTNPALRQQNPLQPISHRVLTIITYVVLIGFALLMILPFIYATVNSFKTLPDIASNPQLLYPTMGWSTSGYQKVLAQNFPQWLLNSFLVAIVTMIGHLVFDSMAGYALARIRFPGRTLAFAALIGTMFVPAIVLLIPRFLLLKQLNLLDTYAALMLPTLADAFGIFLMKQFFESIPGEIEEAAAIDGASRFRMFFIIILPMATPALTALAIFSFQGSWNDFLYPLIEVSSKNLYTLPLGLALLRGTTGQALEWDLLLAGALITTLPMAIIFFVFQRFFVEGVSYSGLKG